MANQPTEDRLHFNLQLFAGEAGAEGDTSQDVGDDYDPFDELSFGQDEDSADGIGPDSDSGEAGPEGGDKPTEPEEFDEIVYNGQTIKIPVAERKELLQKGYNYQKVKTKADETEAALRARDEEVARRFGDQGIKSWDDLVRGWDNVHQTQTQQQLQAFDHQTVAAIEQMQADEYSDAAITMFVTQRALLRNNLESRFRPTEKTTQQQPAPTNPEREIEEGANKVFSEYAELRKNYGDLLPELPGAGTTVEKLKAVFDSLDEETRNDVIHGGMTLTKAFKANNMEAIIRKQQEMAEKRTVANIQDRAKRGAETSTEATAGAGKALSKNQQALARIFGVPPSEVAKRVNKK